MHSFKIISKTEGVFVGHNDAFDTSGQIREGWAEHTDGYWFVRTDNKEVARFLRKQDAVSYLALYLTGLDQLDV